MTIIEIVRGDESPDAINRVPTDKSCDYFVHLLLSLPTIKDEACQNSQNVQQRNI